MATRIIEFAVKRIQKYPRKKTLKEFKVVGHYSSIKKAREALEVFKRELDNSFYFNQDVVAKYEQHETFFYLITYAIRKAI